MKTINFTPANTREARAMSRIAQRAAALFPHTETMMWHMDIAAAHLNGCPLRLEELADADNFNFAHDVLGINRHLNRETGELQDCFLPRYAARDSSQ